MAYVITRLCQGCMDGACVEVCPTEAIVEHRPADQPSDLPPQRFINPLDCTSCGGCEPACPWSAIYDEPDVPDAFRSDVELNAIATQRPDEFHVPLKRLLRGATPAEVTANQQRWGLPAPVACDSAVGDGRLPTKLDREQPHAREERAKALEIVDVARIDDVTS